jgi:hypothetical protein
LEVIFTFIRVEFYRIKEFYNSFISYSKFDDFSSSTAFGRRPKPFAMVCLSFLQNKIEIAFRYVDAN